MQAAAGGSASAGRNGAPAGGLSGEPPSVGSAVGLSHTLPRGHACRYITECYVGMRDDTARTASYRRAIVAAAAGRVVVDIGTGALALLAIIAAEAGAKHVYAIEVQPAAAAAARIAVAAAGLSHRISVIEAFSVGLLLPVKAQLLVHELIGEIAGEEGVVQAIHDICARNMTQLDCASPCSVPSRARTLLAPCEYPDAQYTLRHPSALLSLPGSASALKLPTLPDYMKLAVPQAFEDLLFDAAAPRARQDSELHFTISRAGALCGLALHIELHCGVSAGNDPPDVSSAWSGSHWQNVLFLFDERKTPVYKGQLVRVLTSCRLDGSAPCYSFEALLQVEQGWQLLGKHLYPEVSLNCNDMADFLMGYSE
ncbi:hypothetical protein AB1Y20_005870 [Prymnesium parvum]|uniref:Uncharacterized protein n=1 Tax=Prymnesium parvum TaxID=97485 RepID=A0AB34J310_PRYPA